MTNHTQDEPETFPVIASTHWDGKRVFYVSDLPRKVRGTDGTFRPKPGSADWGYTENAHFATPLSRYWWRRFRADSHYCGRCAHSTPAEGGRL